MFILRCILEMSPFCYSCLNSLHPLQFVCPGTWLCDLTLERYEVREKKVSKKVGGLECQYQLQTAARHYKSYIILMKEFSHLIFYLILQRPRGLKAMHDMDSDSE